MISCLETKSVCQALILGRQFWSSDDQDRATSCPRGHESNTAEFVRCGLLPPWYGRKEVMVVRGLSSALGPLEKDNEAAGPPAGSPVRTSVTSSARVAGTAKRAGEGGREKRGSWVNTQPVNYITHT